MSSQKKINVAVIGLGNMGTYHARNYFEIPQANLVAVCDLHEEQGKKIAQKFRCKFYKNYKKMFAEKSIGAVSIAVPTRLHKKIAIDCIRAGKHILLEKPIATSVREGREIISEARKKGIILTIGHIERFNPAVQKLKKLIKHKKLGKIISIIAKRVGPLAPQIKDAGALIDLAVHDIDIIGYLLNKEPVKIYASGGRAIGYNHEDYAEIFVNYGSASGYIQVNWLTPVGKRELHITGTKGYAELNYITQELDLYRSTYKRWSDGYEDYIMQYRATKKTLPIKFQEPLRLELISFLSCINNKTKPEVTGQDGLRALKIALEALKHIKYA